MGRYDDWEAQHRRQTVKAHHAAGRTASAIVAGCGLFIPICLLGFPWGAKALLVYVVWCLVGRWFLNLTLEAAEEGQQEETPYAQVAFAFSSPVMLAACVFGVVWGATVGALREALKRQILAAQKRDALRKRGVDATPLPVEGLSTTDNALPQVDPGRASR